MMKVYDLFSKRQKRNRGEAPDIYQYETIPHELRVQIIYILKDGIGTSDASRAAYKFIHETLSREYGVFKLKDDHRSHRDSVSWFFLRTEDTEKAIDIIELSFRLIDRMVRKDVHNDNFEQQISPDDAIGELNHRFREHGVGYQYESGQIIRVDSQLIHSEVIRPALNILSASIYSGANAEYLSAYEHYRTRKYKECLNDCLKAFESCIKVICKERKWSYHEKGTVKHLIKIVFDKELIPAFMQSHFSALRSTLEAGVPTIRNRLSGHGQGTEELSVPESIAAYTLHLTASSLLLLARADNEMK